MADIGSIESELNGVPEDSGRNVFVRVFRALVPFLQFGPVEHQRKATNFGAYFYNSTTAASTGEFSIAHGLGRTPYVVFQVLALDQVNAKMPALQVSRAADASRIYLKSTELSTPFSLLVE